jgi:hypothetical protein
MPPDPLVPRLTFECGCGPQQQRDPLPPNLGHIGQRLAYSSSKPKVVMLAQQRPKALYLFPPAQTNLCSTNNFAPSIMALIVRHGTSISGSNGNVQLPPHSLYLVRLEPELDGALRLFLTFMKLIIACAMI